MSAFFSALRFLTVVPVPLSWCGDEQSFHKSPAWYPVVGLVIGLVMAVVDILLRWLLPLPVASMILLVAMIAISGALHLDGLADSADAFLSSRGRERMLEIMKDSATGPMGVIVIIAVVLLKAALLMTLPLSWRTETIVLMPLAGRSVLPIISSWLPYARKTPGTGAFVQNSCGYRRLVMSLGVLVLSSVVLLGLWPGLLVGAVFCTLTWISGLYSKSKIGGFTGDTLGATCELIELVPAVCIVFLVHQGMV